ncbi:unnamed protein product [Lactuca saligna]|uniref:Uncharacterized protein n=1 Tax=Lactuca saligna TaxID=75948 RepID=A0AA35VB20_LACSI|nr:unnamed protein product [Lactuca saligna]
MDKVPVKIVPCSCKMAYITDEGVSYFILEFTFESDLKMNLVYFAIDSQSISITIQCFITDNTMVLEELYGNEINVSIPIPWLPNGFVFPLYSIPWLNISTQFSYFLLLFTIYVLIHLDRPQKSYTLKQVAWYGFRWVLSVWLYGKCKRRTTDKFGVDVDFIIIVKADNIFKEFILRELSAVVGAITVVCLMVCVA